MKSPVQDGRGIGALAVLMVLATTFLILFFALSFKRWEGQPPHIRFDRDFKSLAKLPNLSLQIEDVGVGLSHVNILLKQKDQIVTLVDQHYQAPSLFTFWSSVGQKSATFDLGHLIVEKYKIQEGPATIVVSASDNAWRNFWRGNQTRLEKDFAFDLYPPRLEVLSGQHYINQGGSECVVYRVSEDAEVSGVEVGADFFPGYVIGGQDGRLRFCLFAFAYNIPETTPLKLIARDAAGNEAKAGFWYKLFPKKFRTREITVTTAFLEKVVPEVMSHSPNVNDEGNPLKTFLAINSKLRQANHQQIREFSKKSANHFLWDGAFLQLSNSQVESLFADHRKYLFEGKEVDRQDHVGFDLSVTQQYPIEAANDGTVLYADYFGIYGNTVLVDHGCGLVTLYGHLSSIAVQPQQAVKKKSVLGRSGATGLAGGDHLHFGLFLHGVPVNPTEWWDGKWIKDHVLDRIKAATAVQS